MKYDDASWHYGGEFPADLPNEAGATHIAMFLVWCLLNDLGGSLHVEEFPDELERLRNREETPGKWFIRCCDEKFTDEDLNDVGNSFCLFFYHANQAPYLNAYTEVFLDVESLYAVPDTWESFDKLAPRISAGFQQWP